jgi:Helicase associated domain
VDERTGAEHVTPNERLTVERLEKLDAVGFAWSASRPRKSTDLSRQLGAAPSLKSVDLEDEEGQSDESDSGSPAAPREWDAMFQRLVAFKSAHGHCEVPKGYAEDRQLARWVERVRAIGGRLDTAIVCEARSQLTVSDCEEIEHHGPADASTGTSSSLPGDGNVTRASGNIDTVVEMDAASALEEAEAARTVSTGKRDSTKPGNDALCITDDRMEDLNRLGFVWNLRGKRFEDHWDAMFRQVCCCRFCCGFARGSALTLLLLDSDMIESFASTERRTGTVLYRVATSQIRNLPSGWRLRYAVAGSLGPAFRPYISQTPRFSFRFSLAPEVHVLQTAAAAFCRRRGRRYPCRSRSWKTTRDTTNGRSHTALE